MKRSVAKSQPQISKLNLIASIHWGPRAETVDECAEHTSELLLLLSNLCPNWKKWQYLDDTRFVPLEKDFIKVLLLKGLNYYDYIPYPIVDLGYSASIFPFQKQGHNWTIRLHCGCFGDSSNQVYLVCDKFTSDEKVLARRLDWQNFLKSSVQIWDADWAYLGTSQSNEFRHRGQRFWIGWITFLSKRIVPKLPKLKNAVVEDLGFGWMIFVLPEDFPSELPEFSEESMKRLKSVVDALAPINKRALADSTKKVTRKRNRSLLHPCSTPPTSST